MKYKYLSLLCISLVFCWNTVLANELPKTSLAAANFLADKGIIASASGASGYRFSATITRAEIVKIAVWISGKKLSNCTGRVFRDVFLPRVGLCPYIETAAHAWLISKARANARLKTKFRPDDAVSRAEAAKILLLAGNIPPSDDASPFVDTYDTGDLEPFITAAGLRGFFPGEADGRFRPNDAATREEVLVFAARILGWTGKDGVSKESTSKNTTTQTLTASVGNTESKTTESASSKTETGAPNVGPQIASTTATATGAEMLVQMPTTTNIPLSGMTLVGAFLVQASPDISRPIQIYSITGEMGGTLSAAVLEEVVLISGTGVVAQANVSAKTRRFTFDNLTTVLTAWGSGSFRVGLRIASSQRLAGETVSVRITSVEASQAVTIPKASLGVFTTSTAIVPTTSATGWTLATGVSTIDIPKATTSQNSAASVGSISPKALSIVGINTGDATVSVQDVSTALTFAIKNPNTTPVRITAIRLGLMASDDGAVGKTIFPSVRLEGENGCLSDGQNALTVGSVSTFTFTACQVAAQWSTAFTLTIYTRDTTRLEALSGTIFRVGLVSDATQDAVLATSATLGPVSVTTTGAQPGVQIMVPARGHVSPILSTVANSARIPTSPDTSANLAMYRFGITAGDVQVSQLTLGIVPMASDGTAIVGAGYSFGQEGLRAVSGGADFPILADASFLSDVQLVATTDANASPTTIALVRSGGVFTLASSVLIGSGQTAYWTVQARVSANAPVRAFRVVVLGMQYRSWVGEYTLTPKTGHTDSTWQDAFAVDDTLGGLVLVASPLSFAQAANSAASNVLLAGDNTLMVSQYRVTGNTVVNVKRMVFALEGRLGDSALTTVSGSTVVSADRRASVGSFVFTLDDQSQPAVVTLINDATRGILIVFDFASPIALSGSGVFQIHTFVTTAVLQSGDTVHLLVPTIAYSPQAGSSDVVAGSASLPLASLVWSSTPTIWENEWTVASETAALSSGGIYTGGIACEVEVAFWLRCL